MTLKPVLLILAVATSAWAGAPVVETPGPEEFVSSLPMYAPSIATDSKGQPHVVCDQGGKTQFMKFHKVNGAWSGGVFAVGSRGGKYNASRLYLGQIEIDGKDRAWISTKFGAKEFGEPGQGIWLFNNVATDPTPPEQFFTFVSPHKGNGSISLDAKYPDEGVDMATGGLYVKLNAAGAVTGSGSINAGPGGEKLRFRIASYAPRYPAGSGGSYPNGIWHTAMNGYSSFSSAYQNSARFLAGQGPVTWAAYSTYPSQGSDYSHTGVGIDLSDPRICYMGCVFDGKLSINIWNGTSMVFSPNNLKVLDYSANYEMRHTIQFAPAPSGGTFVFWSSGGRIKMCYLSKTGTQGPVQDVSAGVFPAACTDRFGNLHVVYDNGGIKYRKIKVQSIAPLAPSGRLADTRAPLFRWSSNKTPSGYTLELTKDGQKEPLIVVPAVPANTWQYPSNLAVGSYSWRIKTGVADSPAPWSAPLVFSIPPQTPEPLLPSGRTAANPLIPTFTWRNTDSEASQFTLKLFKNSDSLGTMTVPAQKGADYSTDWTNALPAGSYSWQIKAMRALPGYNLASEWSVPVQFQLGIPGLPVITNPAPLSTFATGVDSIPCGWAAADGADQYDLKVLKNGQAFAMHAGLTWLEGSLNDTFTPAYYTLLVRGVGLAGKGPWSAPVTFMVERRMVPDGTVSNQAPSAFKWSRSEPATRYRLKLAQYDAGRGEYVDKREAWIAQPAAGAPRWVPPYIIPNGKFRWTITDYNGDTKGYSQSAHFQIKGSAHSTWNDPALIIGTWKVITDWRWREMTFYADGVIRTVQGDGSAFTRARWSADGELLTMVSDVTEKCPYQVTATTLTFTLPSGNVKVLSRIR
jgi:hypothetical protein